MSLWLTYDAQGRGNMVSGATPVAADPFVNGLRYRNSDSALYVQAGPAPINAPDIGGIARDDQGVMYVLIDIVPNPKLYNSGGVLTDSTGAVSVSTAGAITGSNGGNPVDTNGSIAVGAGGFGPVAIFDAPLTTTLVPAKAGDPTFTFTRATTAYVQDSDGILRNAMAGEARFQGARRVRNYLTGSSENFANAAWNVDAGATLTGGQSDPFGGTSAFKIASTTANAGIYNNAVYPGGRVITSSVWLRGEVGGEAIILGYTTAVVLTTSWQRFRTVDVVGDSFMRLRPVPANVTFYAYHAQAEILDGASNTSPSEYVSVGVLSAPYNGAGVDGVKYFATTNGNSVPVANLVLQSQTFDVATWGKQNAPITPNTQVAPDGSSTADTFTDTATNSGHRVFQAGFGIPSGPCTASVYLKAGTLVWSQLYADDGATIFFANFNLATGTLGQKSATANSTITPVGGGWYRCTVTFPSGGGTGSMAIFSSNSDVGNDSPSYAGTGKTMFLWGAQYVGGSVAGSYTPTTTTQSVASNVVNEAAGAAIPAASLLGYVAENQATNLCVQSQTFDNASWGKLNGTIAADTQTAPDGSLTADVFTDNATSGNHMVSTPVSPLANATPYTASVYAKKGTLPWLQIMYYDSTALFFANFNLATGAVGNKHASVTAAVVTLLNGWYRFSITFTTTNTGNQLQLLGSLTDVASAQPSYVGSGQTMYLWGAQVEQASDVSSYIPTGSAAVTRNNDALSYPIATNFDGSLGTLYSECYMPIAAPNQWQGTFYWTGYGGNQPTYHVTLKTFFLGAIGTANARNLGAVNKTACAYSGATGSVCLNGGTVATGAYTAIPNSGNAIPGGGGAGSPNQCIQGCTRNVRFYATRLADAVLQSMTA
jgi:hypothetical protein